MKLKLQYKQLSLELALTLGWPLVIKVALPLQAEVVVKAAVEAEVMQQAKVVAQVSGLSARN